MGAEREGSYSGPEPRVIKREGGSGRVTRPADIWVEGRLNLRILPGTLSAGKSPRTQVAEADGGKEGFMLIVGVCN